MTHRPAAPGILALTIVAAVIVAATGGWLYRTEQLHQVAMAQEELALIGQMKVEQIVDWRADLSADAEVLSASPLLGAAVADWLARPDSVDPALIRARLDAMTLHYRYSSAYLVTLNGAVMLQTGEATGPLHSEVLAALSQAVTERRVVVTDLHLDAEGLTPHIGVVAPLFSSGDPQSPIAVVVLQSDAGSFLYPLVQSWPATSESAETLLVRRDGDSVLFLNDLRHQEGAALSLRIPLTQTDVPAVMAVLGTEGVVEGVDYRGVEVFSVLLPIPDSPWFMVAKVDRAEVLSAWRSTSTLIVALVLTVLLALFAVIGFLWRGREKSYLLSLLSTQRELKESEREMAVLLANLPGAAYRCINDADRTMDFISGGCMELIGYPPEALGRTGSVRYGDLIHLDDRERVWREVQQAVSERGVFELVYRMSTAAGERKWVWERGRALYDETGGVRWLEGMLSDVTGEMAARDALRRTSEELERFFSVSLDLLCIADTAGHFRRLNRQWEETLGYQLAELEGEKFLDLVHPDDVEATTAAVSHLAHGREVVNFTNRYRHKNGSYRWIEWRSAPADGLIYAAARDVTQRRHYEDQLSNSELKFRSLFEQSLDAITINEPDGTIIDVNRAWADMLGYSIDEAKQLSAYDVYAEPTQRDSFLATMERAGFVSDVVRFRKKDGTIIDCQRTVVGRRDASGNLVAFQGVYRNITLDLARERALRESEQRFRLLVESSPDAIFVQTDGRFAYLNSTALNLFGAGSADDLLGSPVLERFHPDYRESVRERIRLLNQQKTKVPLLEEVYLRLDGTQVPVEVSAVPIRFGDKDGALVFVRDITERIRATDALRQSEEFVRTVLDNLPVGIAVNSVEPDVTFSYMNDNFARFYHVDRARLSAPGSFWETVYEDGSFREQLRQRVLDDCASGDPGRMHWDDIPLIRAGEPVAFISARNVPIPGRPLMISMVWDVTERKRNELQLLRYALRSETLLGLQLLAGAPEAQLLDYSLVAGKQMTQSEFSWLGLVNEDETVMTIHRWSGEAMAICRLETGERAFHVAEGGLWTECIRQRQAIVTNDYSIPMPGQQGIPEGHVPVTRFLAAPVVEEARVVAIIAVANKPSDYDDADVDALQSLGNQLWTMLQRRRSDAELRQLNLELEQRVADRTAQLEASNKELEAFAYSVSHDLRAPLRAIDGFSRILMEDYRQSFDAEGQRLLDVVRSNAARMDQLITDLLELSRVSRSELQPVRVDMAALAVGAFDELASDEEKGHIQFAVGDIPPVFGDPVLLKRVWYNLLSNAVKFTAPVAERRIEVGGYVDGRLAAYYVRDTGVGFDPRYAHKLFGVFQRLHGREEFEGTGIGLAIVQRVVLRHGGRVWAEGEPGEGATFYFALPGGENEREQQVRGG